MRRGLLLLCAAAATAQDSATFQLTDAVMQEM
jgi:hypothetical protein